MRIVTRPDFDGIVCAVLLLEVHSIKKGIHWIEPNEIQSGKADIQKGDILANLPYSPKCSLWFDHHVSNQPENKINGSFEIAPSAAGVVYRHYRQQELIGNRYDELVEQTDIIDGALLNQDQVRFPEKYPYIILSMTIKNKNYKDIPYWNRLVDLLRHGSIKKVHEDNEVQKRIREVIRENDAYKSHLKAHTRVQNKISITDFRSLDPVPDGNRFLTYCLFPESTASVKIRYASIEKEHIQISIGKSIFTPGFNVNIGNLLSRYGGGGHAGAGGCTLKAAGADSAIEEILDTLFRNRDPE